MSKTDDSFAAKFGPPPPAAMLAPPPPAHVVLLGQLAVCMVLLVATQPPFVLRHAHGAISTLCPGRVVAVAAGTVGLTYVLFLSGTRPSDSFRGACEMMWRALR